jgi:truncated hemoglobin YjbI
MRGAVESIRAMATQLTGTTWVGTIVRTFEVSQPLAASARCLLESSQGGIMKQSLLRAMTVVFAGAIAITAVACSSDDDPAPADNMGASGSSGAAGATQTMFDKYGLDAFVAVNDEIITRAAAADTSKLGDSFTKLDAAGVEELRTNLAAFLVQVYGGPANYKGRSMAEAHAGLGITDAQYTFFVTDVIVPALKAKGVSDEDIQKGFAPPVLDPAFQASIVGK